MERSVVDEGGEDGEGDGADLVDDCRTASARCSKGGGEQLTLDVELVHRPRSDVERLAPVAKSKEGKDGGQERRCDEVQPPKLIDVGRLDSRGLQKEGQREREHSGQGHTALSKKRKRVSQARR